MIKIIYNSSERVLEVLTGEDMSPICRQAEEAETVFEHPKNERIDLVGGLFFD